MKFCMSAFVDLSVSTFDIQLADHRILKRQIFILINVPLYLCSGWVFVSLTHGEVNWEEGI